MLRSAKKRGGPIQIEWSGANKEDSLFKAIRKLLNKMETTHIIKESHYNQDIPFQHLPAPPFILGQWALILIHLAPLLHYEL